MLQNDKSISFSLIFIVTKGDSYAFTVHGIYSTSRVAYRDATVSGEHGRLDHGFVNWLIKNGVAREFCAESYDIYGRCPFEQFRMIENDKGQDP